jgi:hypothetical protein
MEVVVVAGFMFKVVALGALLAASPAIAEVCRWKDAEGVTHYSRAAPDGVICEKTLRIVHTTLSGQSALVSRGPDYGVLENEFQRRRLQRMEAELKADEERQLRVQKASACNQATGRFEWLRNGGRAMRMMADGQPAYLDESEHAREVAAARQKAEYYCR